MDNTSRKLVKNTFLGNQVLAGFLIFAYCTVYGITSQVVLSGIQLLFFLSSLMFALSVFYVRDPMVRKEKAQKGILFSQITGTALVFAYIVIFGVSSLTLLKGFQLVFFMSSYTFAMSIFYIRDPERIQKEETVSVSSTNGPMQEKNPCFINEQDLSWLVRELNNSLSTVIGFTELMLSRDFSEQEKDFMLRKIYEQSLTMSCSVSRASSIVPSAITEPKNICERSSAYETVDLLDDNR